MNKKKLEKKAEIISEVEKQNQEMMSLISTYKEKLLNSTEYSKELQDLEHRIFRIGQRFASNVAHILFNK